MIFFSGKIRNVHRGATIALLVSASALAAGPAQAQQSFDALRQTVAQSLATQPEASIIALLDAGLAEQQPAQAIAISQRWLRDNIAEDPILLYKAGQAAELSGDWRSAVTLYQQYLRRADLKSDTASDAIAGMYTLLINQLNDDASAYSYARTDGHRLTASPRGRQFDRWFLDEAVRRDDAQAVAERLLAVIEAGVSDDLLTVEYERYFDWLLSHVQGRRLDQQPLSPDLVKAVKSLTGKTTFSDELKLLLDWEVSVKAYSFAMLGGTPTDPPIAEAKALLNRFPEHALRVQIDWAGGRRGRYYRGDPSKYWPVDLAAKMKVVDEAVAKLSVIEQVNYRESWHPGYYNSGPVVMDVEQARAFALANPKLVNSKLGPPLGFDIRRLSAEQINALAPLLERNPSPEAALVRAMAAAGEDKDYDKAMDALLTKEAWRLGVGELRGGYADLLWHMTGRPGPGGTRDAAIKRSAKVAQRIQEDSVKPTDQADKRLAAVRKFWKDYKASVPTIPAVRDRLVSALRLTPEALAELVADDSVEARLVVRDALDAGISGTGKDWDAYKHARSIATDRYRSCFDEVVRRHNGGLSRLQTDKDKYVAHPLGAFFEDRLAAQVKQGEVESWLVFAWLNTQFPEDNKSSVALMQRLVQSPAWKSLPYEARNGARQWFDTAAMTPAQAAIARSADPQLVFKDLLALTKKADAQAVADVLGKTFEAMKQAPTRLDFRGLDQLEQISDDVFTDPKVFDQIVQLVGPMRAFETSRGFGERLLGIVNERRDAQLLHDTAAYLWRHTEVHHRTLDQLIDLADAVGDEYPSAAHALASCGLQTIARHSRGHTYFDRDSDIPRLKAIRGRAAVAMNLVEIPVQPSHPAFPIYQSQREYLIGNIGTARKLYTAHADQLLPAHRQLSVPYLLWVLQSAIDNREEARQEELVKALLTWAQESPGAFSVEQRIALDLAYGDIALQRGMLPEAQQIFARARNNEAYAASFDRYRAALRLVRVQRIAKDFDAALQTLMELDAEKVPRLTTEAHFARAEVYYDLQEYEDAADEIAMVLERDPDHADAKILQGRVHLKRQKLIEATEVELGSTTEQPSLVPGQRLKVTLNDPTLSVSSGSTDIEVAVWATSGDKEYLLLRQFGDQKTKYRGDVRTALGKPSPEDGVLQVIGDDEVYYAYSEQFREKRVNLEESRGGPIQVASDAMLMASARKLLSENEQRVADMQRLTEALGRPGLESLKRTNPERYAAIQAEAEWRNRQALLQARVKPGNPIHLRVIDPDRSRTPEIDELPVSVSASSGDVIGRVILKETGTHTGQFEGEVQTTTAQAMAFASSSESGRNPNMVISPKSDYPAWRPVVSDDAEHTFTIDLNDNVELGTMKLVANEPGAKLKRFIVETGMNSGDMTPVAVYPKNIATIGKPWHPSVVVMNDTDHHHNRNDRSVYDLNELQHHVNRGWMTQRYQAGAADNVAGISEAFTPEIPDRVEWKRQGRHHNAHVVYRFRGYFYEPTAVKRRFKLEFGNFKMPEMHPSVAHPAQYLLAVNGRPITSAEKPDELVGEINLGPGVHRFEIWATGWDGRIGFGRSAKLWANLSDSEQLVEVADSFFDPTGFPEGALDHRNTPGVITADEAGGSFELKFASGSRARLVRIVFVDHEGPAPSLNRVSLHNVAAEAVLPVQKDYAELRKNDVLEILTGDRIAVRYLDDRFVTKGKEKYERFLNVSYTDGEVEFADIEPRYSNRHGRDMPYYEQLLRFALNKPLQVVLHDADMDETTGPDTVMVSVTNGNGQTKELTATETGPSTGTFRAWITPVAQKTQAANQIQVSEGGRLTATYMDHENLKPGVPYKRVAWIDHGMFSPPRIEVAHATLTPYEQDPVLGERFSPLNEDQQSPYWAQAQGNERAGGERIKTRFTVAQQYLGMDEAPEGGLSVVHGRQALIDVVAPHMALGSAAAIEVYVQTDSGRRQSGENGGAAFDVNVPGTMVYHGKLGAGTFRQQQTLERGGYIATFAGRRGNDDERSRWSREQGRFRLAIPLITGLTPTRSYADREAFSKTSRNTGEHYPHGLIAKAGERIHIGVKYKDPEGKTRWSTASAKVIARPMLDVMREDYRETIREAHVGEKLFVRIVDPYEDRTPQRDTVRVYMQTKSGQKHYATLTETDFNTGIFKGVFQLTFAEALDEPADEGYDVGRLGMPVKYGDAVGIRYTDAKGRKTPPHFVTVAKGSDGTIAPFSKQYDDAETATQTQFAMAESFLELARRHRSLGEEDAAKREFDRARQLLANTVAQFNDPETRSHAEYLLGNLTMEDAEITEEKELQAQRYQSALARYMKVTGSYPDSAYASKSQFKIALIYERLGEPDIAAQEYVKLAYKYPESEYLATSMARLGTHFQRKAVDYERQAKPLLEDESNKDDYFEGTALNKLAQLEYIKAAQIFERLQERFPSHELAGTAGLRAGQIYMRADDLSAAVGALESVYNNESYDGPTLRCEAMYWAGRCRVMQRENLLAYSLFKRITYDFPESKWAAYARSQLSSERMLNLDKRLEIERLEAGQ